MYEAARTMRRAGRPFKRIAAELGVSPSSVHRWTSDIELSAEQIEHNQRGPEGPQNPEHIARRTHRWSKVCRNRRLAAQREGRRRALDGDPLHLAGCMLYWAEGSKGKNVLHFANSELAMQVLFKQFVVECFAVPPERFSMTLNVYLNNGLRLEEIEQYWLAALELPKSCTRKHCLNHMPTSSSGQRPNKLPYGVCSLRVLQSTYLAQHLFGAIQEYAGFDEPRWVG